MSLKENEQWLESAAEFFEEALETGDFTSAVNIIDDVRLNGFIKSADSMKKLLEHKKKEEYEYNNR